MKAGSVNDANVALETYLREEFPDATIERLGIHDTFRAQVVCAWLGDRSYELAVADNVLARADALAYLRAKKVAERLKRTLASKGLLVDGAHVTEYDRE